MGQQASNEWRIRMASYGLDMFINRILYQLGMLFSVGFAYPWLDTWYNRKWAAKLLIDGRRVEYVGTPSGLFQVFLKTWVFSILTLSIYWWFRGRRNVDRYVDSNMTWASS